ncbi:MAG: ATP-dependent RecD-like DNA helicase [Firmicutes bacterium]|nr:ATP-dependent RecD-like DNA helicase [Bacillota bacterium]
MSFTNDKTTLKGVVEEVVYYNNNNYYAVCYVQTDSEYTAVIGYMPYISEGETITVTGSWTVHAEYGRQFKAEYFEKDMPKEKSDILKYLSSGVIKGVRQATAEKIINKFGEKALEVIAHSPEQLAQIKGISPKKAAQIGESYSLQLGAQDIIIFLQKYGISAAYAVRVHNHFGGASVDVVKNNPYVLAQEVYGIGFKTADKIAINMGVALNSPARIKAAISFTLWEGALNGHTYLPRNVLIRNTCNLIGVDSGECDAVISSMLFSGMLMEEKLPTTQAIYQPALHFSEKQAALLLTKIAQVGFNDSRLTADSIINEMEKEHNIKLAYHQKEAVYSSLENGAVVITGGPGTGKTTIIKAIKKVMEGLGKKIALAAPTGRAAKRISEVCGMEAKTLHRLLEVGFSEDEKDLKFNRDDKNPLQCSVLIVDEMSMVDIVLFHSLLKAVAMGTRLIMVGDSDQLPSVGAGIVLSDIISSGAIHTVSLTEIFRQAKESMIVVNAHKINSGQYPVLNKKNSDFFLVSRQSGQEVLQSIIELCKSRLPATYRYDPVSQIQVLTPTRKGPTGVNALNEQLQKALNPPNKNKREKLFRAVTFREGDKVMQIKNNYQAEWKGISDDSEGIGVFNGDIGRIEAIDTKNETITVIFDDKIAVYDFMRLDEIDLAYAVTVHKSQGSEFDAVVMPMYPIAPMLQNRNLLYTAITRARELVVLVGRDEVIKTMVDNVYEMQRFSMLQHRLRAAK